MYLVYILDKIHQLLNESKKLKKIINRIGGSIIYGHVVIIRDVVSDLEIIQ